MPVLDLIGVLFSIPGLFVLAYHLYVWLCEKWNDYQDYRTSLENARIAMTNLRHEYNSLLYELRACHESVRNSGNDIGSFPSGSLSRTYNFIQSALVHLANTDSEDVSRNAISRFLHSGSINGQCHQLEELANGLIDRLQRMRVYCPLILFNEHHIPTAQKFVEDLRTTGYSCEHMIQTHQRRGEAPSLYATELPQSSMFQFKSQIYTVKNPPYITLDFDGDTPEGRLKKWILRSEDEIQEMFTTRKIILEGREGSGKTCIMRGLPTCHGIQQKFMGPGKGGMYMICVEQKSDCEDIKKQLSEIATISGGWHLREKILSDKLSAGVLTLAAWFLHKDTLFLVDSNATTGFAGDVEGLLEPLCRTSGGSAGVFSRGGAGRGGREDVVRVASGSGFGAEEWLLRLSETDGRPRTEACESAMALEQVVALCKRERRLLALASVCYRHLCRNCINGSAWVELAGRLGESVAVRQDAEVGLAAVFVDLMKPLMGGSACGSRAVQRLYRTFRMVVREGWTPVQELRKKWKVGAEEYESVLRILVKGRLCRLTERVVGNESVKGIEADASWLEAMRRACVCEQVVAAA